MNNHGRFLAILAAATLAAVAPMPASAADSVTVTAQVTMAAPCLTVGSTSIDFGGLMFSPDGGAPSTASRPTSFANCGSATERVFVRGSNAAAVGGGATWSLIVPVAGCPALGLNRFSLVASITYADINVTVSPNDQQIDLVPAGAGGQFDRLTLTTPCQGSAGSGATMTFNVIYTATF